VVWAQTIDLAAIRSGGTHGWHPHHRITDPGNGLKIFQLYFEDGAGSCERIAVTRWRRQNQTELVLCAGKRSESSWKARDSAFGEIPRGFLAAELKRLTRQMANSTGGREIGVE
jgi:hypothetical protein